MYFTFVNSILNAAFSYTECYRALRYFPQYEKFDLRNSVFSHSWHTNCDIRHIYCVLTYWGRVAHICVGNLTIIGSDNDLLPNRRQAIIWTNAGILLIDLPGTNFSEILIEIHTFSVQKTHLKMSAKWRLFRPGLNVLNHNGHTPP